jgi:hypothetical protein
MTVDRDTSRQGFTIEKFDEVEIRLDTDSLHVGDVIRIDGLLTAMSGDTQELGVELKIDSFSGGLGLRTAVRR